MASHSLGDIKGLDADNLAILKANGIGNADDLVAAALDFDKRAALAKTLGIDSKQLSEWVNRADLMRLNGVGEEYANLLEECGVDSTRELRRRVPANLHAKMTEINASGGQVKRLPTVEQVESWVAQAKQLTGDD